MCARRAAGCGTTRHVPTCCALRASMLGTMRSAHPTSPPIHPLPTLLHHPHSPAHHPHIGPCVQINAAGTLRQKTLFWVMAASAHGNRSVDPAPLVSRRRLSRRDWQEIRRAADRFRNDDDVYSVSRHGVSVVFVRHNLAPQLQQSGHQQQQQRRQGRVCRTRRTRQRAPVTGSRSVLSAAPSALVCGMLSMLHSAVAQRNGGKATSQH